MGGFDPCRQISFCPDRSTWTHCRRAKRRQLTLLTLRSHHPSSKTRSFDDALQLYNHSNLQLKSSPSASIVVSVSCCCTRSAGAEGVQILQTLGMEGECTAPSSGHTFHFGQDLSHAWHFELPSPSSPPSSLQSAPTSLGNAVSGLVQNIVASSPSNPHSLGALPADFEGFAAFLTRPQLNALRNGEFKSRIRYIEVGLKPPTVKPMSGTSSATSSKTPTTSTAPASSVPTTSGDPKSDSVNSASDSHPSTSQQQSKNGTACNCTAVVESISVEARTTSQQCRDCRATCTSRHCDSSNSTASDDAKQWADKVTADDDNGAVQSADWTETIGTLDELLGSAAATSTNGSNSTPTADTYSTRFWNLDRLDQFQLPLNSEYDFNADDKSQGAGVNVYLIDSGCRTTHTEFEGRAKLVYTRFGPNAPEDAHGHGSSTAATAGGRLAGVAKKVTLNCLAVLDAGGNGAFSDVLDAWQWLAKNGQRPAVLSQSFGGAYSESANEAIQSLMQAGFIAIVAAGNDGVNACSGLDAVSPASAPGIITVGSSSQTDAWSSFSNFGPCVSMSAPGEAVVSAWATDDKTYSRLTGTSQATPAVAGAVALYLARHPQATQQQVHDALRCSASARQLSGQPRATDAALLSSRVQDCPSPQSALPSTDADASRRTNVSAVPELQQEIPSASLAKTITSPAHKVNCSLPFGANSSQCKGEDLKQPVSLFNGTDSLLNITSQQVHNVTNSSVVLNGTANEAQHRSSDRRLVP